MNIQTVKSNALLLIAAIGGWLLLDEILSMRGLMGCGLMLGGMLLSQLWGKIR